MKNNNPPQIYEFDFAFSFAGEDRQLVEDIKNNLSKKYKVFYDNDFQSLLAGKDLYSYLRKLYKERGKFVICFISESYRKKIWTNLEFTAIKERLMATFFASDFLIPIIIDDTKMLEDIPAFIGFYKHQSVEKTCEILMKKYNDNLIEDNYIRNIYGCIEFIINNIFSNLSRRNLFNIQKKQNKIITILNDKSLFFEFEHDKMIGIPCILIYKSLKKKSISQFTVPSLFISWKRTSKIEFCIHQFEMYEDNIIEDINLHDLICCIEDFIIVGTTGGICQ